MFLRRSCCNVTGSPCKEHIATHTNLILSFKPALYSSTLVIKVA